MIFFNGKSSDDVGVVVEKYPTYHIPARKSETVSVPGRNGDLVFLQDAWDNITQEYEVYLRSDHRGKLPIVSAQLADWLNGASGYATLTDDYDIDHFREAFFVGPSDIENIFNQYGRVTLSFNCKPQRFLAEGLNEIAVTSGQTVLNPKAFEARPLIKVALSSSGGTFTINGLSVASASTSFWIDCEDYSVTDKAGSASLVGVGTYPALSASSATTITYSVSSGSVSSVKIIPRWWEL